jgi:UDP-N-acetylmuramate dehydrogenase
MGAERVGLLARELGCTFSTQEPLSRHVALRIGGIPEFYVRPSGWDEAARILTSLWASDLRFKILGSGSNLMAADGPLPFGVVHLARLGGRMRWEGATVEADADVPMPALASESVRRGLRGLEGMGGIPGTVGGAVVMNAGAFGNDVAEVLTDVALIEPGAGMRWHPAADFSFAYRRSDVKARGVIAGCRMAFVAGDPVALRLRFAEVKARREATQPWRAATAGSVFKNPPGGAAGRLLEELGFKGKRRGAAGFSDLHANFLVNHGGATFEDALALCEEARAAAAAAGVTLEYEMEIWT